MSALIPIGATAILSFTYVSDLLVDNSQSQLRQASKYYGFSLLDRILLVEKKLQKISISLQSGYVKADYYQKHFNNELNKLAYINDAGEAQMLFGDNLIIPKNLPITKSKHNTKLFFKRNNNNRTSLYISMKLSKLQLNGISLIAEVNPDYLWGKNNTLPYSTNVCVLNNTQEAIYCSHHKTNSMLVSLKKLDSEKIPQYFDWENNNDNYLAASWGLFLESRFDSENWTIIASQEERLALLPIKTFSNIFPSIILLSLLITIFLSISQIRRNLVPLEKLIAGIRSVSNNDFSKKVIVESDDEFQELADSFNTMTMKLRKQFNALTTLSDIDHLILSNPDIEHVITTILKRLHKIVTTDFVSITIIESKSRKTAKSYLYNDSKSTNNYPDIDKTYFTKNNLNLLLSNQYYKCMDVANTKIKFLEHLSNRGATYVCAFPVVLENKIKAVINLGFEQYCDLKQDDQKQIRDIADRLAVALATTERDIKLYQQAHFDALTKLPNRELFADRLNQEIIHAHREEHKVALLFIDLDRFKQVNDTLGHSIGDKLLQHTAARLNTCVRDTDTVARLGGDEFTLIISNIKGPQDASLIAENAIKQLAEPLTINGHELFINSSIGISIYPDDGGSVEELLRNADAAMYRAKEQGRGRYQFFEERMNAEDLERTSIERDLRFAIERNEFSLCYQPQIELSSGNIIGAEALLRWSHPERGSVSPEIFIPIAEDNGLIEIIGEWVLRTACTQFTEWKTNNIHLKRIAVNVSSRQFLQNDFVAVVNKILVETDMSAKNLEIEITESLLMEDRIDTITILNKLSAMGISLSIDDFGTGYSSLSYLKRLPVDALKIDRSFMEGIPNDDDAIAISASIIALAHTLHKKVIAEGVETVEQLALLRNKNCDIGQGYFFNKPLKAQEFEAYLSEKSTFLKVIS
ncbi:MAG: EAL domain-containing protein [Gammaproteobacteria bacterium]